MCRTYCFCRIIVYIKAQSAHANSILSIETRSLTRSLQMYGEYVARRHESSSRRLRQFPHHQSVSLRMDVCLYLQLSFLHNTALVNVFVHLSKFPPPREKLDSRTIEHLSLLILMKGSNIVHVQDTINI